MENGKFWWGFLVGITVGAVLFQWKIRQLVFRLLEFLINGSRKLLQKMDDKKP